MSGPFYGALAASASVFVAILTALLVNNYVQIKSDRRRVKNELQRITEDLGGLRERKEDHEGKVDELVEKRESDYREKARERVDEFIDARIPPEDPRPIEKISVDELYAQLIASKDCESPEELEREPIEYRHQEILEDRMDEIENKILNSIIPSFASQYRGRGQSIDPGSEFKSFAERVEEKREEQDLQEDEQGDEDSEEPDITIEAEFKDPLSLEDFIEKYKEEYSLTDLDEKTVDALETQYEEVVDRSASIGDAASTLISGSAGSSLARATSLAQEMREPPEIDIPSPNAYVGLNPQEQQKLSQEQEKLRDVENEISILENREQRLKREKEGLHPEDLVPTLVANVATIILSVVIPVFAYLLFTTNTAVTVPSWLWLISHTQVNVFLSWLLGLCVVFESIHARINDREPTAFSLYNLAREGLSQV